MGDIAVLPLLGVYALTNKSFTGEEEVLASLCKQIHSDLCTAVAYATLKMKAEREGARKVLGWKTGPSVQNAANSLLDSNFM